MKACEGLTKVILLRSQSLVSLLLFLISSFHGRGRDNINSESVAGKQSIPVNINVARNACMQKITNQET